MSVMRKCGYCLQVHAMGSECPKPEAQSELAAPTGSPSVDFVKREQWADACMAGAEAAQEMRLPRISERWSRPDLRDAWLHGFATEMRNRMENAKLSGANPDL